MREKPDFTPTIASPRCQCRRLLQPPVSVIFSFCWLLDLLQIRLRAVTLEELNWEYLLLVWALTPLLRKTCCSHVSAVGTGYACTSRHWDSG